MDIETMAFVVGLVGKIASGKGVVSDYLSRRYNARVYRFSDVLSDILLKLSKPNTRENLQALGFSLRQIFGDNVLSDVLKEEIKKDKSNVIVVDGIRYWNEFNMVKDFKNNLVVSVTAPLEVRFERASSRATRGEAVLSFEDFKKNEEKPTEKLIDEIAMHADIKIENMGSKEALLETLDTIFKDKIKKRGGE
jgi:dephospho-CoA kinase